MKKIMSIIIFLLITISCSTINTSRNNVFFENDEMLFSDISWGTSPEQVVSEKGLPDKIYYNYGDDAKVSYVDDNGYEHKTVVDLVWVNDTINDSDLLEHAKNNNIPIRTDIDTIINGYHNIWVNYDNIQYFDFNSVVFLTFKDRKLTDILFMIDIKNMADMEKQNISADFQNYFIQHCGSPNHIDDAEAIFIWQSNNTEIMLFMVFADTIMVNYSYKIYKK